MFFTLTSRAGDCMDQMFSASVICGFHGKAFKVQRWISLASRLVERAQCVRTDASPFCQGRHGKPIAWMTAEWTTADHLILQGHRERSDMASRVEAVRNPDRSRHLVAALHVSGTLHGTDGRHRNLVQYGTHGGTKAIAAEFALKLVSAHVQIAPKYLRSEFRRNAQGAAVPAFLRGVPQSSSKARHLSFFWACSRALLKAQ